MKVCDKPLGMNAGISAGTPKYAHGGAFDVRDGFFNYLLNPNGIILKLPTGIGRAVISDYYSIFAFHDGDYFPKSFFMSESRPLSATSTASGVVTTTKLLTPKSEIRALRAMQMLSSASTTVTGPSRTLPRES